MAKQSKKSLKKTELILDSLKFEHEVLREKHNREIVLGMGKIAALAGAAFAFLIGYFTNSSPNASTLLFLSAVASLALIFVLLYYTNKTQKFEKQLAILESEIRRSYKYLEDG